MKRLIFGILLTSIILLGGVKDIVPQGNTGVYSVFCTDGRYGPVSNNDGTICVSKYGKSKCSHDWSIQKAASWLCKSNRNSTHKTTIVVKKGSLAFINRKDIIKALTEPTNYILAENSLVLGTLKGGIINRRINTKIIKYYPKGKLMDAYYRVRNNSTEIFYVRASECIE